MRIVITGGCGFFGRGGAMRLLDRGTAAGPIDELVLFDNAPPVLPLPGDRRLRVVTGDIADRETVASLIAPGTHAVFHLAAIVSGQAEADTDLGYRVNLDGTRAVLDACRALGTMPRLIFASSLAVYGGALPPEVGEATALMPQSSYGAQKAIGELLVNDYSRKGFIDGMALRLPTVVVRPGLPNRAASTFASSIIREPLTGRDAVCPVSPHTVMALASPRRIVAGLVHALDLPSGALAGGPAPPPHGLGLGPAARVRRGLCACARSPSGGAGREPHAATAGLLGIGRREGGGGARPGRGGGLPPYQLGARSADPGHHL